MGHQELLPLVTFENGSIQFRDDVARETFASPFYKGKEVHLVSVIGPSRTGKSFLMSYLTNQSQNGEISGSFQAGYDRFTEGILIYKQPISWRIEDKEHLIFFIDSQGVFDNETDPAVSGWIAGLTMLISDVEVVNLRSNIGADDLSEIRRFAEFASAFPEQQMTKSLVFLLRDAPNYNISGEEFIENIWRRCSTSADLSEITQMISNRFQHIGCICAPAPSHELRIASGAFRVTESDWPLLNAFEELKRKVIDQISTYGSHHPVTIDYCKKAAQFFVHEAPRITTSVQVMTEARMVQAVRHALDLYSDELKKAQFENLEIIHEEAKRRGLHTFQSQDATIENIEQMKERFLSGIEPLKKEIVERFRVSNEERREREELAKLVEEGKAEIVKLSTLEQVLGFVQNNGLESLLERLLKGVTSSKLRFSVEKTLKEILLNHTTHRVPSHFEDLEYQLVAELKKEIENGSYQEVPRIDQLEGYVFSKLKKISKEIELVGRVVAFTSDFVNIIRTRAENRFREAIRESHGVLVKSWERREQFEKQRVANEQMLADLEQQEAQRKAYLSEQERQNAAIEEAERRERSSSRNLIEFDPFPKVDANQREQEEKEKEIQRQQQQFDHKWLLEKNHEMERKVEEEKQRLQKAEKELRLRQMQDDLIRRDNEARERKEREAIDRRWQNEQRQKNREIENDIERRKFEENQILEGWQSELQAANLERQRKADSRQQQMSDAEKMERQWEKEAEAQLKISQEASEQRRKEEQDKRMEKARLEGIEQEKEMARQREFELRKRESEKQKQLEIQRERKLQYEREEAQRRNERTVLTQMLQPTPAPPLTREQKNKVEIDKRIQQFQGMLQDMVAQSQLDHPFTKEKASVLWRQLEILLENELAELRNTFYGDFSYARETQMKDLLNGEYSKVVGHADDEVSPLHDRSPSPQPVSLFTRIRRFFSVFLKSKLCIPICCVTGFLILYFWPTKSPKK